MRLADKYLSKAEHVAALVAMVIFILMAVIEAIDIFLRFALKSPILGLFELIEILMVVSCYLTFAATQRLGAHVNMRTITMKLPFRGQHLLSILGLVVGLAYMSIICWFFGVTTLEAWSKGLSATGSIGWPFAPAKGLVFLGCLLLCLRLILQLYRGGLHGTSLNSVD